MSDRVVTMSLPSDAETTARRIHIRGVVQGVGFRPLVFRLATSHALSGWVLNGQDGVRIHVEGTAQALDAFVGDLSAHPPPAAEIAGIEIESDAVASIAGFEIRDSSAAGHPVTRISPDLPVCEECLREMSDPANRRYRYPYINCTNCGPRFSIVEALPYDRAQTTMAPWALCDACAAEYHDPADRRFHAQPVACPACGPQYLLVRGSGDGEADRLPVGGDDAIRQAARLLADGEIVAIKGIGGYHLACDAGNRRAVVGLRERKYRKDKPFAVMVRDLAVAGRTVELTPERVSLLESPARPIVLAPSRVPLPGVAPDNIDLGVMLPYTPLHHLLFASGAPDRLVMTSGNRSSEPIAYEDEDALRRLSGIACAWLIGERRIARRVDDSVIRAGASGPAVLRRSRGIAPGAAAILPTRRPVLALGADLKNTVALAVEGQVYVSQHIGDLADHESFRAFDQAIRDMVSMYGLAWKDLTVVHDSHPQYASTAYAEGLDVRQIIGVQHHRAHVASVLAERGALDERVLGVALDGTGYGDDGAIWGGEWFAGSVRDGFERVGHLREALLPGGDAAAHHPVQAVAGFLAEIEDLPDLAAPPFCFPERYRHACALVGKGIRVFRTTSAGRLFDTAAALAGFTRPVTFEGQAAMWLEHMARQSADCSLDLPCGFTGTGIDWRGLLAGIIEARLRGVTPAAVARAFHRSLARAIAEAIHALAEDAGVDTAVLSGGVMQNALLLEEVRTAMASDIRLWINHVVPPNDGGISLGQAALAAASMGAD